MLEVAVAQGTEDYCAGWVDCVPQHTAPSASCGQGSVQAWPETGLIFIKWDKKKKKSSSGNHKAAYK